MRGAELGWVGKEGWLVALTLTHKSIILVLRFGTSSPDYRVKIRPKGDGGCERERKEALMVLKIKREWGAITAVHVRERERERERGVEGVLKRILIVAVCLRERD